MQHVRELACGRSENWIEGPRATRTHVSVVLGVFILFVVVEVGATIVILVLRETHVAANLPLQKLALP